MNNYVIITTDNVLLGIDRLTLRIGGVMPMSVYETLMVLASFGTFMIALLALVVTMINKK